MTVKIAAVTKKKEINDIIMPVLQQVYISFHFCAASAGLIKHSGMI